MQQTETYKLNLIDTSDTFSPEALNKNTEKLETELARVDGALDGLVANRLYWTTGTYKGTGEYGSKTPMRLGLNFKPLLVIVSPSDAAGYGGLPWFRNQPFSTADLTNYPTAAKVTLTWESRAVSWYSGTAARQLNSDGVTYYYFILGIKD